MTNLRNSQEDDDRDDLERDLEADFRDNLPAQRINRVAARLQKLEQRFDALYKEVGALSQRPVPAPTATAQGERVLAKAQQGLQRRATPEGILEYAMKVLSDPTAIGVVQGHLADNNFAKALDVLEQAEQQNENAELDGTMLGLEKQLGEYDAKATVSELTTRFGAVERLLASLQQRLGQLESRPQAPATALGQTTMAKAPQLRARRSEDEEQELMAMIDAFISSPTQAGQISSLIQAGQTAEARRILEGAQRAHESERVKQERKSWAR